MKPNEEVETNYQPQEEPVNFDNVEGLHKPEDNATKREIFAQNAAPTENFKEGDLWFDADDNNQIYRASAALAWVSVRDGTIAGAADTANWSQVVDDDSNKPENNADKTSENQADVDLANVAGDLDDVSDGSSYGKINVSSISSGDIVVLGSVTAGSFVCDTSGFIRGGQTAYNTGTGFFLGYDTDAYKFSIGDPSGSYLTWDGTDLYVNDKAYAAGDKLIVSSDSETAIGYDATYTLAKSIEIAKGGELRIKFDMHRSGPSATTAYARIYKNGAAFGTEQTSTSDSYETKSEDISGWAKGDSVELYIHGLVDPQTGCYVENFRIYTDKYEVSTETKAGI